VLIGALTMAAGHFLMAFETAFLFALLCLVSAAAYSRGTSPARLAVFTSPTIYAVPMPFKSLY